jgi:flagellar hook assembly protein FlgD
LSFNKPNPFNPITLISYDLPFSQKVNLTIYDLRGNVIITLIDKKEERGIKNVQWNAINKEGQRVPTGIYFYKISTNNFESSKKMILLK